MRPDHFASDYVGRDYWRALAATEVLSVGMEAVFEGTRGGLLGRAGFLADIEHRHLILGLCATV